VWREWSMGHPVECFWYVWHEWSMGHFWNKTHPIDDTSMSKTHPIDDSSMTHPTCQRQVRVGCDTKVKSIFNCKGKKKTPINHICSLTVKNRFQFFFFFPYS